MVVNDYSPRSIEAPLMATGGEGNAQKAMTQEQRAIPHSVLQEPPDTIQNGRENTQDEIEDDEKDQFLPVHTSGSHHKAKGTMRINGDIQVVTPDAWLDTASKYTTQDLAQRDNATKGAIHHRTQAAAWAIANRDGQFYGDVLLDLQKKQLANGIIHSWTGLISDANAKAKQRLKKYRVEELRGNGIPKRFSCVFSDRDCTGHHFCAERYINNQKMLEADKQRRIASEDSQLDISNSNATSGPMIPKDSLTEPATPATTVANAAQVPSAPLSPDLDQGFNEVLHAPKPSNLGQPTKDVLYVPKFPDLGRIHEPSYAAKSPDLVHATHEVPYAPKSLKLDYQTVDDTHASV